MIRLLGLSSIVAGPSVMKNHHLRLSRQSLGIVASSVYHITTASVEFPLGPRWPAVVFWWSFGGDHCDH